MMRRSLLLVLASVATVVFAAEPLRLVWPTPNPAWAQGKPIEAYVQHAGSGEAESGTFGSVRSGGQQFHEGIDLKSISRDRHGEPRDSVFAAMDGVVRYVNPVAGDSSYGRYIVLEHPQHAPAVYTLYAHLVRIAAGLRSGDRVAAGQTLGVMGHTAGRPIPRARAHLHFEIGLVVTRDFQEWYDRGKFGSRNEHGSWNGMNLIGIDPLGVFNDWRAGRVRTMPDVFARMAPVVRVRIATQRFPDFVVRYPSLLTRPPALGPVGGWEIAFNSTGVPFAWTPLTPAETAGLPRNQPYIVSVNAALERREPAKTLAVARGGRWMVGRDLDMVLEQLFGLQ